MKKNYLITVSLIIFLSAFSLTLFAQQNKQSQNVKLTVLNSMERIGQKETPYGGTRAIIKAAKNEVESFQVVVQSLTKNIAVVKAEMSDLSGNTGTISKENFSLFREEYTRVRLSTPRAELPPGLYADPLVPFINPETGKPIEPLSRTRDKPDGPLISKGFTMYAVPFEVWKGENQPIWVDLSIPKDAVAGEYKGTFTITVYNGSPDDAFSHTSVPKPEFVTTYSLPVILTVWNFTLPDGPSLRNSFGGVRRAATDFGVAVNSQESDEIELNYCKMMADNRINPPIPDRFLPEMNDDGSLKITSERTQALKKFIEDFHVTDFPVPNDAIKKMTTSNQGKVIRYYRGFYQYLEENGWEKRAYLYMLDEPNTKESYQKVVALGKVVHEAAPKLRCLVVEQTWTQNSSFPDIDPAVDIWCPLFSYIDREGINQKLSEGDDVWSYTALAQRAPGNHPQYNKVKDFDPPYWAIDQPLTSYRMPTWMNWQYKIDGLLYWSTIYSQSISGVTDPWFSPVLSRPGKPFNGEGYLMYPGMPCGINGPVASIRLKNLRDAMEDYEYFTILEKLTNRETVTRLVGTIVPNWWAKPDPKDFLAVRERIANEILKLKK
ncbi:MAG: glycoside hydrolase domain-containing protein [Ginsengibacter sp.]